MVSFPEWLPDPRQAGRAKRDATEGCTGPGRQAPGRSAIPERHLRCLTMPLRLPTTAEAFTEDEVLQADQRDWFHVYSTENYLNTQPDTFSEGWGASRFAPLFQADGMPVHTYYSASTVEYAVMESVLHDVPLYPPGTFELDRLRYFQVVQLRIPYDLKFVSFHTLYLAKMAISRAELVDSPPEDYPRTRAWAQAAYLQQPTAQGIGYGSRRHDAARCMMLFGQRLPSTPFNVLGTDSLATGDLRRNIVSLMQRLDLNLI